MRGVVRIPAVLAACVLGGCRGPSGAIYTHTFEPLTLDFRDTPVVQEEGGGNVKQIDYYVRVQWSANGIGEVAKEHGFAKVHYADLETLSVLGVWTQRWAHVYGTRAPEEAEEPGEPAEPEEAGGG